MGFGVPGPSTVGPGASGCWCTRSWGAGSPGCSCMGHRVHQVLGCWCTGSPGCWCTGSSSSQGAGARGAGSLGVLVHGAYGPQGARAQRASTPCTSSRGASPPPCATSARGVTGPCTTVGVASASRPHRVPKRTHRTPCTTTASCACASHGDWRAEVRRAGVLLFAVQSARAAHQSSCVARGRVCRGAA